jgi:hypothetical protein
MDATGVGIDQAGQCRNIGPHEFVDLAVVEDEFYDGVLWFQVFQNGSGGGKVARFGFRNPVGGQP